MKEPGNLILLLLQARIIMVHTIFTSLTQHFTTDKWPSFKRAPYWEWQHETHLIFVIHIQKLRKKKKWGDCYSLPPDRKLHLLTGYITIFWPLPFLELYSCMQLLLDQYSFIPPTKKTNSKSNYERRINKKAERHWKNIWGMENRAVKGALQEDLFLVFLLFIYPHCSEIFYPIKETQQISRDSVTTHFCTHF